MSTLTKEEATIERLLPDIRATHKEFLKSGQETVELARQIGEMLWKLKECVKHGEFAKIVEERCELEMRTATTYMKVFSGWALLEKKEAAATTIDGAVKLITKSTPRKPGNRKRLPKSPPAGSGDSISDKGKPGGACTSSESTPASTGPASGEAADSKGKDLGQCPNCGGKKWKDDGLGPVCAKCRQPHGEPAGNADEDKVGIQRSKTVKTVEALMRAFDDLNRMVPRKDEHVEAIASCKFLLKTARAWK